MDIKNEKITGRDVDFAQWYTDVCKKAELMDYSSTKGFIIYRPYGYAIWEMIQHYLDAKFKETGHENVYMPLVIPESLFKKEKDHVTGFAPETLIATIGGKEEIVDKLNADYNNEKVVPFEQYTSKVYLKDYDDKTISVYVVDPRESSKILSLRTAKGRNPIKLPTNGVIISEKFCKNYDVEVGDYITIESKEGIKKEVEVVDICEWYFQHYIFMSEPYYKNIFDENIHYNTIAIETSDIESLKESMNSYEEVSSISDFGSFIDQFEVMIQALNFIIIVIIVTAGALAFVVLINLTQVNISERIREIATLKVLGFRNNEVYQYIFKEILLLTLIGAIIGLPLGKVEETFIMNIINMENIMFGNDIKIMSYIYSFLITFIFTIIVLLSTRKNLRQIEMIESLKSVE